MRARLARKINRGSRVAFKGVSFRHLRPTEVQADYFSSDILGAIAGAVDA